LRDGRSVFSPAAPSCDVLRQLAGSNVNGPRSWPQSVGAPLEYDLTFMVKDAHAYAGEIFPGPPRVDVPRQEATVTWLQRVLGRRVR
jgi:hypothetical protein